VDEGFQDGVWKVHVLTVFEIVSERRQLHVNCNDHLSYMTNSRRSQKFVLP